MGVPHRNTVGSLGLDNDVFIDQNVTSQSEIMALSLLTVSPLGVHAATINSITKGGGSEQ